MDARTTRFTDRVASLFEHDGLPPIAGRIFALLLLSEEARSLDQLSAELGVSKASASTNTRPWPIWSTAIEVIGAIARGVRTMWVIPSTNSNPTRCS